MSLFVCENCRAIDNSACTPSYAVRAALRHSTLPAMPILCSACESGRWHGEFELRIYDPDTDGPIDDAQRLLTTADDAA